MISSDPVDPCNGPGKKKGKYKYYKCPSSKAQIAVHSSPVYTEKQLENPVASSPVFDNLPESQFAPVRNGNLVTDPAINWLDAGSNVDEERLSSYKKKPSQSGWLDSFLGLDEQNSDKSENLAETIGLKIPLNRKK